MDAPGFDRLAKILAASRTRRGALAALFGGGLGALADVGSAPQAGAAKKAHRRKGGRNGKVSAEGPCGDGGPRHNDCKRHGQCCTGYCRNKRCRCRRPGEPCTEDRNCCPERQGATCQDGICRLADGGGECSPGETRICYSGPAGTANVGICRSGVQTCTAAETWASCAGEVLPQAETCNGLDDDCDGVVDNGFACPSAPNATGACVSGACQITCTAGFGDCDASSANGCEAPLLTDMQNCGACAQVCAGLCPDGTPRQCAAGVCGC